MKIVVIGAHAKGTLAIHGQTSKVRNYTAEIKKHYPNAEVYRVDTFGWKKNPIGMISSVIKACKMCDVVLILPAENGLRVILPICVRMKKKHNFLLLYPVVGGWLPTFCSTHPRIANLLKEVDRIYVETKEMFIMLKKQGFRNVEVAPVFSRRVPLRSIDRSFSYPIPFCTFSRVTKQKGISLAIKAINIVNMNAKEKRCTLDIYGVMDEEYNNELQQLISSSPYNAITYRGTLDDKNVINTLSQYASMLFPTFYPGEGYPATVLESMMASTPVIASDWRYNGEIINDTVDGLLFDLSDQEVGLANKIELFIDNIEENIKMRAAAYEKALNNTPEVVLQSMYSFIDGRRK